MTAPRVFFYVQHLLGIGHLRRAASIAQALVAAGAP
jgi:predicted glycosyltransferase